MIATLTFAGLRIGELLALRWRDVDLAADWLSVNGTNTDGAARKVKIRPALHAALAAAVTPSSIEPDALVFPTRTGARLSPENFRNRVLAAAVNKANENLVAAERAPLPSLTPHSLRRTFCSLLYALGESPPVVMAEMGHTDPGLRTQGLCSGDAPRRAPDRRAPRPRSGHSGRTFGRTIGRTGRRSRF
jgi:integrase